MKIIHNLRWLLLCISFLTFSNTSNASYQFLNINNSIFVYISGNLNFSSSFDATRDVVFYKSIGKKDKLSNNNTLWNNSNVSTSDYTYLKEYYFNSHLFTQLGAEIDFHYDWYLIARLGAYYYSNSISTRPSINLSHERYGSFIYNTFSLSEDDDITYEFTPKSLISREHINGSYLGYHSPEIYLRDDSSLLFTVSYIDKPKRTRFKDNFLYSLDHHSVYYSDGTVVPIYKKPITAKIDSNYNLYVNYIKSFNSLHTLSLSTSYTLFNYSASSEYDDYEDYNHYLFGDVIERLFRASIAYNFNNFTAYYIYGSSNASSDATIIIEKEDENYLEVYDIKPKLSGSSHTVRVDYTPDILNKKLNILAGIEIYNSKIIHQNKLIDGSNTMLNGHHNHRYSLQLSYKLIKNVLLRLDTYFDSDNAYYNVENGGYIKHNNDNFNGKFSIRLSF